jgi:phage shock protein PspC (stress-responsive transcriptional regulator)
MVRPAAAQQDRIMSSDLSTTGKRLQRSGGNKMISGVAGGIAEYANVDPLLVRVLLAVTTVFGGAGILLYALGWLFLPMAGQEHSLAETLIGRGRRTRGSVLEAVCLIVVVAVFAAAMIHSPGTNLGLVALVVVGAVLIYRHLDSRGVTRSAGNPTQSASPTGESERPTETLPLLSAPMTYPANIASQSMEAVNRAADRLAAEQLAAEDRAMHGPWPAESAETQPEEPKPPARRPLVGVVALSALALAVGLLAGIDQIGSLHLSPRTYFATALAVVGAGLVVGAFFGRARWLILLGIPLTIAVLAASLVPWDRHAGFGGVERTPATVSDINRHYDVNVGLEHLDLSRVNFAGHDVHTDIQVGAGKIEVLLPRDVDVTVHGHVHAGNLSLFNESTGGTATDTVTDLGADGRGGGKLDLNVNAGVGDVEVSRVA